MKRMIVLLAVVAPLVACSAQEASGPVPAAHATSDERGSDERGSDERGSDGPSGADDATPGVEEYRPGLPAGVALPAGGPAELVVVLVPGGGWSSADPAGLAPLGVSLVASGHAVVTMTYRTAATPAVFPDPVDDVRCAVAFAAARVPDVPVVLVGHSAGAHLAALAALAPDADPAGGLDCPHPARAADAVVGLAGPYDITETGGLAGRLFGVPMAQDPDLWAAGNPMTYAAERPEVPFLILHGESDVVVPTRFSADLAEALTAGGHDVVVELLPEVDHNEILAPAQVGDLVAAWLTSSVLG